MYLLLTYLCKQPKQFTADFQTFLNSNTCKRKTNSKIICKEMWHLLFKSSQMSDCNQFYLSCRKLRHSQGVKGFAQLQKDNFRLLRSSEPILISYKFWISNPIKGFWEVHQNPSKLSLTIQNLKLNRRLHLFYEIYHWFKWF